MVVNMSANKCHLCLLLGTLSEQEGIFIQSVMLSGLMTVILLLYSPYFGSSLSLLHTLTWSRDQNLIEKLVELRGASFWPSANDKNINNQRHATALSLRSSQYHNGSRLSATNIHCFQQFMTAKSKKVWLVPMRQGLTPLRRTATWAEPASSMYCGNRHFSLSQEPLCYGQFKAISFWVSTTLMSSIIQTQFTVLNEWDHTMHY
jgi:hypothetical protein